MDGSFDGVRAAMNQTDQLFGVVEGFYGLPWNARQRHRLFQWSKTAGLNTYLYAPKDDLKHRANWRSLYDEAQSAELAALIGDTRRHGLRFIYALAPGLDLSYANLSDLQFAQAKLAQLRELGCRDFAILFDDIPTSLNPEDQAKFSNTADAQAQFTNTLFAWLRGGEPRASLLFCPTEYCGLMAQPEVHTSTYLDTIGRQLHPEIGVFWTGPDIVSREISLDSIRELSAVLRRKPVIWDNLCANDYDRSRIFPGVYRGRDPELRGEVQGFLLNPNCQFESNFLPVHSFVSYAAGKSPQGLDLSLIDHWLAYAEPDPALPLTHSDFTFLLEFFDTPFSRGPRAKALVDSIRRAVESSEPKAAREAQAGILEAATQMRGVMDRFARIRNRDLFHAWQPHLWALNEELEYVRAWAAARAERPVEPFSSRRYPADLFRGGVIAELQRLTPLAEHCSAKS